jgi:hypothetical protein
MFLTSKIKTNFKILLRLNWCLNKLVLFSIEFVVAMLCVFSEIRTECLNLSVHPSEHSGRNGSHWIRLG